ncbi:ribose-phosphate pyrophosphokinase 1 [Pyronema domesticum]|uniref:Ribose-phosphate pyrophosphokinase 1 n=1 Tax=Pyronema omphalodes (strain CBS 100304) TaxID=1076935 RepID=U4LU24_PYROM|nr:ribose-phosphate pyrophosphokinase 1 [Pyronema domesticum]CCX31286.1 Similar to Ribose-phosphate pyrophosphokinase 1; acc. no. P32895 [Pyronema omphalodes CBS 100304]
MRRARIFSGSSHDGLTESICERLGTSVAKCRLRKFANGETSVEIGCSVRDQDVFIVQSGSENVNDSIIELLILISACKGGSANKITAVMPYFPYSKQSKKKSHRGAITARMVSNLLHVAGVDHVITVDLHASQMQGFFKNPVDNLYAEPLLARWIRYNIPDWRSCVVVSKNPGGTKRVTQLADVLKLNFALITTDRRRVQLGWMSSRMQSHRQSPAESENGEEKEEEEDVANDTVVYVNGVNGVNGITNELNGLGIETTANGLSDSMASSMVLPPHPQDDFDDEYTDDQAQSVTYGRLVQGHIVDDDYPSPSMSATADMDPMIASIQSLHSLRPSDEALGGTIDAHDSDDEEDVSDPVAGTERMITLVGDVADKTVLLLDDMIDRSSSWIAAAEHCKKRANAKRVICLATHGVFGGDCLKEMQDCPFIDQIVVTNSFPIDSSKLLGGKTDGLVASGAGTRGKLTVIDLSMLLGEAIRRNHNGESVSALFQNFMD